MRQNVQFWRDINANDFILSVIEFGYKLPFKSLPFSECLKNNKSSLNHPDFVVKTINDLLNADMIFECKQRPFVVNPLTVADNTTKLRLVLDLRHVNEFVILEHIKFEDWHLALQLIQKDDFLFSFDFKSGYHHIEIHPDFYKYLGFSWVIDG